jgi:hypothetical protein
MIAERNRKRTIEESTTGSLLQNLSNMYMFRAWAAGYTSMTVKCSTAKNNKRIILSYKSIEHVQMCRCADTTKCIIWMFSEESLWSFLKLLFVIHETKQTISGTKVDFLEDKSSLQTKNWRYSAVSQTTGTLPVYSWQERRHTILFLLSPASQSFKKKSKRRTRISMQTLECPKGPVSESETTLTNSE